MTLPDTRANQMLACLDEARCLAAELMDELPANSSTSGVLKLVRSCINLAIQFLNPLIAKDTAA